MEQDGILVGAGVYRLHNGNGHVEGSGSIRFCDRAVGGLCLGQPSDERALHLQTHDTAQEMQLLRMMFCTLVACGLGAVSFVVGAVLGLTHGWF